MTTGRGIAAIAAGIGLLAMAGCAGGPGSDAETAGLAQPPGSLAADAPAPAEAGTQLAASSCPQVQLREGTAILEERVGNEIDYVAAISDTTRDCREVDGQLVMTIGVRGRVTPGPVASDRNVVLPIRIAVIRGGDVVYSELGRQSVGIGGGRGVQPFTYIDADVRLPLAAARELVIFAGFDEGPTS